MSRLEKDRAAWTELVTSVPEKKKSKYRNVKTDGYDSKKEARIAGDLQLLEATGKIQDLEFQVPLVLVEGCDGVRPIKYVCDFRFRDTDGIVHWMDAKGMRTDVYKIKKKLAYLLHGIIIEEV